VTPEQWKRAKQVLEGARRHSPADRSQYVSVACSDDPELLKEVESLLNLGSTPPASKEIKEGDSARTARTEWEHLTVLAEVGRGAFGRVYRAWDPALQHEVALKLIKVDPREPDFAESVFHEARLLVKVRHPHVVSVLGARHVGSEVGIWMEFINGPTLADAVEREGPMSAVDAAAAGIAVCDALAAVHGTGLLHRDIKARNVMRDASGRVVLMDFGAGAERRVQPPGEIAGTPLYMAPELVKGAGASVASDIYSVGVLLFHLVTGEYPVTGRNIYELEAAHESGARVRLADRKPDLPPPFVEAVDRALSPDPALRFRRAVEFKDALTDATARITAPVVVPPQAAIVERWPWIAGAALVGTLLSLTLFGFLTSVWFNLIIGRTGEASRFANESAIDWPLWGLRALFAPAVYMGVMFLLGILVRWVVLLAVAVVRRVRRPSSSTLWSTIAGRLRPTQPNATIRLAALAGSVALVVTWWRFLPLLSAIGDKISTAAPGALAPLAPANVVERFLYRRSLELTMLVIVLGLYRAVRIKRDSGARLDVAATAWAAGVLAIALLMTVVPYRLTLHNDQFARVQYDGMRCYVLGQDARELLVYCPESAVPRNRIIAAGDERLRPEGTVESVFVPADQAAPAQQR
jgi:serine/threonine protein kinase